LKVVTPTAVKRTGRTTSRITVGWTSANAAAGITGHAVHWRVMTYAQHEKSTFFMYFLVGVL
jgi:hypothetical protein